MKASLSHEVVGHRPVTLTTQSFLQFHQIYKILLRWFVSRICSVVSVPLQWEPYQLWNKPAIFMSVQTIFSIDQVQQSRKTLRANKQLRHTKVKINLRFFVCVCTHTTVLTSKKTYKQYLDIQWVHNKIYQNTYEIWNNLSCPNTMHFKKYIGSELKIHCCNFFWILYKTKLNFSIVLWWWQRSACLMTSAK